MSKRDDYLRSVGIDPETAPIEVMRKALAEAEQKGAITPKAKPTPQATIVPVAQPVAQENKADWFQPGSKSEALARGASQGATFGFGDEIGSALSTAIESGLDALPFANDPRSQSTSEVLGDIRRNRDEQRAANAYSKEMNPGTYFAGEMAGGMAAPLAKIKGLTGVARAAMPNAAAGTKASSTAALAANSPGTSTLFRNLGAGAGAGALQGAAAGLGYNETTENLGQDIGLGVLLGGAAGAGLGAAGSLFNPRVRSDMINAIPRNLFDLPGAAIKGVLNNAGSVIEGIGSTTTKPLVKGVKAIGDFGRGMVEGGADEFSKLRSAMQSTKTGGNLNTTKPVRASEVLPQPTPVRAPVQAVPDLPPPPPIIEPAPVRAPVQAPVQAPVSTPAPYAYRPGAQESGLNVLPPSEVLGNARNKVLSNINRTMAERGKVSGRFDPSNNMFDAEALGATNIPKQSLAEAMPAPKSNGPIMTYSEMPYKEAPPLTGPSTPKPAKPYRQAYEDPFNPQFDPDYYGLDHMKNTPKMPLADVFPEQVANPKPEWLELEKWLRGLQGKPALPRHFPELRGVVPENVPPVAPAPVAPVSANPAGAAQSPEEIQMIQTWLNENKPKNPDLLADWYKGVNNPYKK